MRVNTKTEVGTIMEDQAKGGVRKSCPEAWIDSNTTKSHLESILRPILIAMSVAGCYSYEDINNHNTEALGWKCPLSFAYRLFLFIMILTFFAKMVSSFFFLPTEAFQFNALISLWLLLCLVWFILFWKASSKRFGKQTAAFKTWNSSIMPQFQELNVEYPIKSVRRKVIIFVVLGISLTFCNGVGTGIQFALPVNVTVYTSPLEENGFTIVAFNVLQLLCSAVWILPNMYAAAITYVLKHAFIVLNEAMCTAMKTHACSVPPDFQKLRILHMHLCTLVTEFDHDLGWYYATLCSWHIGLSCFCLYQIIRSSMEIYTMLLFCFWLVSSLSVAAFGTCFAATVNDEAHAPLDNIYYINVSDVNFEKLAQINLFLSKLTGTQVGFSTCGLLIITKEFILTIAGVFLTYFAVLYTL